MKIQRPNIKLNKTWMMLLAAIALALLTTWLTLQYLTQKEQSIEADLKARSEQKAGATIAVVVPTRPMPPGSLLDESSVAARDVPADFVYADTITVAQFEAYKGHALLREVERGKPLRKSDVREVFADFSGTLKAGKRAMTIEVDEINSVSHMVEPNNLVDLMLVLAGDGAGSSNQTVVPFLDQVRVLATGQKITQDDPASMNGGERRQVRYSNITLEVTPTQAARLALGIELGKIRAVLRNENDLQSVYFDSVNENNLLEEIRPKAKRPVATSARAASGPYIEYFIGGQGSSAAAAPAMNIPIAAQASPSATPAPMAQAPLPQNLAELLQMSLGSNAAAAIPSK